MLFIIEIESLDCSAIAGFQTKIVCRKYQFKPVSGVLGEKVFSGNLVSLVDDAVAFVKRNSRVEQKFDGFKQLLFEEYPFVAIKEAIVNAVCHRDYSIQEDILVELFDNRIEIVSPGGIPNDLSLKEVYGFSNPRNYTISKFFKKIGYADKLGRGLCKMEELALVHGLKKPVFETGRNFFKTIFFAPKGKLFETVRPSVEIDLCEIGLNKLHIKALNFFQNKEFFTISDCQKLLGTSRRTTQRNLKKLVQKHLISMNGIKKGTKYSIQ